MDWIKRIILFFVIVALQVLLLSHLEFLGVCHPFLYIVCLMLLPITMPVWVEMILGALLGLLIDIFCNSIGVHMAACVLMMFIRQPIVRRLVFEPERLKGEIDLRTLGTEAYIKYLILMVLTHHTVVFTLSAWSWHMLGWVMLEILISGLVSALLILGFNALRK